MRHEKAFLGLLAALSFAPACDDKDKTETPATAEDAGAARGAALDPSLAEAVAAASGTAAQGAAPRALDSDGPPANGIFAPGAADRELAPDAPPKISLGETGSDPKLDVSKLIPAPGWKRSGTIQLLIQSDPRQGPLPVEFSLSLEAQKPKAPAGDQPAGERPSVAIVATVTAARVAHAAGGGELDSALKKLKGSRIEYQILPSGGGYGYRYELGKGADEGLGDLVRSLTEILATVSVPFPDQPIGTGAFFMATTRDAARGIDLVSYRLVKVERASATGLTLNLNTKRYATSPRFDMPGVPDADKMTLDQFTSVADGSLTFESGTPIPVSGSITLGLTAMLIPPDQPTQRATVKAQTRASLNFEKPAAR